GNGGGSRGLGFRPRQTNRRRQGTPLFPRWATHSLATVSRQKMDRRKRGAHCVGSREGPDRPKRIGPHAIKSFRRFDGLLSQYGATQWTSSVARTIPHSR